MAPRLLPRVLGRGSEKGAPSAFEKGLVLRLQEALDMTWNGDKNLALVTMTEDFRGHVLHLGSNPCSAISSLCDLRDTTVPHDYTVPGSL